MTTDVKIVMAKFLALYEFEKKEFLAEVERIARLSDSEKVRNRENLNEEIKRATGPTSSSRCAYCGK